jgi:hypothetical protein
MRLIFEQPPTGDDCFNSGACWREPGGQKHILGKRHCPMADTIDIHSIKDRGGRRSLADRRKASSPDHFPERRFLRYRRSGLDRRNLQSLKLRKKMERRKAFKEKYTN